jgi:hypothetical protein
MKCPNLGDDASSQIGPIDQVRDRRVDDESRKPLKFDKSDNLLNPRCSNNGPVNGEWRQGSERRESFSGCQ